jgi:hypothetical protein
MPLKCAELPDKLFPLIVFRSALGTRHIAQVQSNIPRKARSAFGLLKRAPPKRDVSIAV